MAKKGKGARKQPHTEKGKEGASLTAPGSQTNAERYIWGLNNRNKNIKEKKTQLF